MSPIQLRLPDGDVYGVDEAGILLSLTELGTCGFLDIKVILFFLKSS